MMAVGQKKLGIKETSLVRAMAAMGGGIGASGGACGILLGALSLLGSVMGKDAPEGRDNPLLWKACIEFHKRFAGEVTSEWGSVNCRDITGLDWKDPEQTRAFYKGEGVVQCAGNTGKAARILGEILEKYLSEKTK